MSSDVASLRGLCPAPFFQDTSFSGGGHVDSRICNKAGNLTCCVPCPITDWVYPDSFNSVAVAAQWIAVIGTVCCLFLLLSWAVLPVDKTARHYLSICLALAVLCMNLGFVIPLAARPEQCFDEITPNGMQTSAACATSGSFLVFGGYSAVFWVFLRALSLHLQICWEVAVGHGFMLFAQVVGWGIPVLGLILTLVFSGVSFRFGAACHVNHSNSLADLWIPLLFFAGVTIIVQFATFGYCIKVYLVSLADNQATTEHSNTHSYPNSIRTLTPNQAYRRVRRVIQLQWRGIAIVLLIIADVIFFSVVFAFQDNTVTTVQNDASLALPWVTCLVLNGGGKHACLQYTRPLVVDIGTVAAVLVLLAMNGLWLLFLLGRRSMVTGWIELIEAGPRRGKREFVSVDARLEDLKKDTLSPTMSMAKSPGLYGSPLAEFYRSESTAALRDPAATAAMAAHQTNRSVDWVGDRLAPEYFGGAARYHAPSRSFSSPRPPLSPAAPPRMAVDHWNPEATYARPTPQAPSGDDHVDPLGTNRIRDAAECRGGETGGWTSAGYPCRRGSRVSGDPAAGLGPGNRTMVA